MSRRLDVLSSWCASGLRGSRGLWVRPVTRAPAQLFELYEAEGCPESRRVRELLTALDLDAMIFPCPTGGTVYRPGVPAVPHLIDRERGTEVSGGDVVAYLADVYGAGAPARNGAVDRATSRLASAVRGRRGIRARPSRRPAEPLELYSFEASPFARIARETLSELELPYRLRNVGKGALADFLLPAMRARWAPRLPPSTRNRRALYERTGRVQVPYLVDPNTGVEMFESDAIRAYLIETYGA
jgi:hypothetical protein